MKPIEIPFLNVVGLGKSIVDATGTVAILHEIDFSVAAGETVAIVGVSGSGKSTLLSLLAGLDLPSCGQVQVQGQDIFALSEDQRAQWRADHVGFVFQSFQLLSHLTALENVLLPLELKGLRGKDYQAAKLHAQEMLEKVGLGSRLHHTPKTLSGGEQQRVALARAFMTQPDLLFADEPTGSLDAANGAAVMELLFALHRDAGTTLILVTHDMQLASRCQRILRMEAGRLTDISHTPQMLA